MKKVSVFLTSCMMAATFLFASQSLWAQTDLEQDLGDSTVTTKGLKGKINGVDACHCPDDAGTCYCSQ